MSRRRKQDHHDNTERWMVSYADFITLLFAFFVVMYAISAVNEGKYKVLSESLESAFAPRDKQPVKPEDGNPETSNSIVEPPENTQVDPSPFELNPHPQGAATETGQEALDKMQNRLTQSLAPLLADDMVKVKKEEFWLEVELNAEMLFGSGSAKLREQGQKPLLNIARIVQSYSNVIRVEGYTDNIAVNSVAYPTNWELSAARSASVIHLFEREGVNPSRLSVVGYGEYRPVASNDTPEGRRQNRKVKLIIVADDAPEYVLDLVRGRKQ
ncbi:MAG: flagellar motor protein MotD [Gammaproteobacteria bacterium]|nr:flagellar motor protein MotD [Gammaproteobacteria bacterium]